MSPGALAAQQSLELLQGYLVDPADHAEVQKADRLLVRQDEEISRMGIRVVEAIAEDHVQVGIRAALGDIGRIDARGTKLLRVGHAGALEAIHGQDPSRGALVMRPGSENPGIVPKVLVELLKIARFAAEVELEEQLLLEVGDVLDRLVEPQLGAVFLGQLGQRAEDLQIVGDLLLDARVLHLDHHRGAIRQARLVHLTDRSGGHGLWFEVDEDLFDRLTQLRLDGLTGDFGRIRWSPGLQPRQFVGQLGPDQIGSCAQNLTELDEGGPQFGDGRPNLLFPGHLPNGLAIDTLHVLGEEIRLHSTEPLRQPILDQHSQDLIDPTSIPADRNSLSHCYLSPFEESTETHRKPAPRSLGGRESCW